MGDAVLVFEHSRPLSRDHKRHVDAAYILEISMAKKLFGSGSCHLVIFLHVRLVNIALAFLDDILSCIRRRRLGNGRVLRHVAHQCVADGTRLLRNWSLAPSRTVVHQASVLLLFWPSPVALVHLQSKDWLECNRVDNNGVGGRHVLISVRLRKRQIRCLVPVNIGSATC